MNSGRNPRPGGARRSGCYPVHLPSCANLSKLHSLSGSQGLAYVPWGHTAMSIQKLLRKIRSFPPQLKSQMTLSQPFVVDFLLSYLSRLILDHSL